MWIIAGPNGAGKSTFTGPFLESLGQTNILRLNADEVTAELRSGDPASDQNVLNLRAAKIIDAKVVEYIYKHMSFLVETVLSSGKYRDDLEAAKAAGFKIGMVYISLYPPELSPLRVQERVSKGGHAVETATAIKRYHRSHQELAWFAARVDRLLVFDNSSAVGEPVLLFNSAMENGTYPPRIDFYMSGLNPEADKGIQAAIRGLYFGGK
jgi:predicted ABC-type ATPase